MYTWDGYDALQIQLDAIRSMSPYQYDAYLKKSDYERAKRKLSSLREYLIQSEQNSKLFTTLAKKHLKLYADSEDENEWEIAQEYLAFAEDEKHIRIDIRSQLQDIQNNIRGKKLIWEKAQKMAKLQETMEQASN